MVGGRNPPFFFYGVIMSDIVKARSILKLAAKESLNADIKSMINHAVSLMHREKVKPNKAPKTSQKITPYIKQKIMHYVENFPEMSNQQIANELNINPGRVTEAMQSFQRKF